MKLETVRVTERGRYQLITLKRRTGIPTWNTLCRWALCTSLAEPTPPRQGHVTGESAVEMTWRTFAGDHEDLYLALLKQRCRDDGLPLSQQTLQEQFRLHLHRGIGYLVSNQAVTGIAGLIEQAIGQDEDG